MTSIHKFRFLGFLSLIGLMAISSCTSEPEEEVTAETFVYLVTQEGATAVESLTITELSDGTGTMTTPNFVGSLTNTFDLVIDRVDATRANIMATEEEGSLSLTTVNGAGFFTPDSVFVQFTLEGFSNDIRFSGSR